MPFYIEGHDKSSDDLFGGNGQMGTNQQNAGWSGSIPPPVGTPTHEPRSWGGEGYTYERDPETGGVYAVPGTTGADKDVSRYRKLGARRRPAVQLDQTQANRSKGLQMGSLARLESAAAGREPSRAALLGKIGTEDAIRATRATGRGPGGSLAAMRGSLAALSNQAGTAAAKVGDMRAQEMGRARGEFFGGGSGMRKQDIGAAVTNAQLDAANRDLEQRRQQQFEKLGWDTRNADLFAQIETMQQDEAAALALRRQRAAEEQADYQKAADLAAAGSGTYSGFASASAAGAADHGGGQTQEDPSLPERDDPYSDARTKRPALFGSLGPLARSMRK